MLTISAPLSAGQATSYHAERWRSTAENYYSAAEIGTQWQGQLAAEMGLRGAVQDADFAHLAYGRDLDGSTLIAHRASTPYVNAAGKTVTPMGHRAGWDATFSAPKSVSLVALVGGDERLREAHRESVAVALAELERYAQARMGDNNPAQTTGRLLIATFDHDSARPVDGYAAPQLHTHAVIINMTRGADGQVRSVQSKSLLDGQSLATAVYRTELASRLLALGYEVRRVQTLHGDVPEIKGLSPEYLEASSPRRAQILHALAQDGRSGAAAAQIAAHQTRDAKSNYDPAAQRAWHQEIAASFGNQPPAILAQARARGPRLEPDVPALAATAVTFAVDRNIERDAVADERAILKDALVRSMGQVPTAGIRQELASRVEAGELLTRAQRPGAPAQAYTTPAMVAFEQHILDLMTAGRQQHAPLADARTVEATLASHQHLYAGQRAAVAHVLASPDTVTALHGIAGAGKTTTLQVIAESAKASGYDVQGRAPTARAADQLATATGTAQTLQRHLTAPAMTTAPTLYVLDEASLASTIQMHAFLERLEPDDRVLLVGDIAQHEGVEAGRVFAQLQESGLRTARLDDVIRQPNPIHRQVVEQLAIGDIPAALASLNSQQRIHEISNRAARNEAVAQAYTRAPDSTIVIAPDNDTRAAVNEAIHAEVRAHRPARTKEYVLSVLVPRQEMTGPDRATAMRYNVGDTVRYTKGSKIYGLDPAEYVTVRATNSVANTVTVQKRNGGTVTYDPTVLKGVTVYREAQRSFAAGDRVQFTQPYKAQRVTGRDMGTVVDVSGKTMRVKIDAKGTQPARSVGFQLGEYRHLEPGWVVTSYSSQGQTADRVILVIDTDRGGGDQRTAYVSISRARHDVQIWTNDMSRMAHTLNRDRSHSQAIGR